MGLRYKNSKIALVQFHPEIISTEHAMDLMRNL
ncbi:MAG TPA: glutamine amidotransferase-related protein [Xylella sp.]